MIPLLLINLIQLVKDGRKKFYSEFDRLNLDYTKGYGNFIFIKTLDINRFLKPSWKKEWLFAPVLSLDTNRLSE
jgi:hypothetical protein